MTSIKTSLNVLSFLLLLLILAVKAYQELKDAPCDYRETVALDPSQKLANGSYLYDDIIVPAEKIGTYNYEILIGKEKIPSKIHVRGCICDKLRPCISICCPHDGEYYNGNCYEIDYLPDDYVNVTTNEGKSVERDIRHQFGIQYHRPCETLFCPTQPQSSNNMFEYSLFENGSLFYKNAGRMLGNDEFCMGPVLNNFSEFRYFPWVCNAPNPEGDEEIIQNGIIMLSSVPFMLITILLLTSFRNNLLTTGSICFYLLSLSVAFTTLPIINLFRGLSSSVCPIIGYTTYFALMASYSWLFVISCDFHWNLYSSNPNTHIRDLKLYSLFAWGLPTCLLGIVLLAQRQDWPDEFKPNIGGSNYCFFEPKKYNILIYFCGPAMILISSNVVMFFLTIKKLSNCKFENERQPIGFKQKLHVYLEKCELLAELFLITGVSWIFEILSYCLHSSPIINFLLFFVKCQGFFIFLLVVFKKSNILYLKERYQQILEVKNETGFPKEQNEFISITHQPTTFNKEVQ